MYALKIIDDIKNGVLVVDHSKTLLEYINEYMTKDTSDKIQEMADAFVDSIIIHGKYDYEIKLVYDDQFADLQKLKKEKEAQSR